MHKEEDSKILNFKFKKYRNSKDNIIVTRNGLSYDYDNIQHLRFLQEKLNSFISVSKQSYCSRMPTKLTKFHKSSKTYSSLLKTFLNNKKVLLIPPLYHQDDFVTNFNSAELFNSFFAGQCSLIKSNSKLPSHLHYKTEHHVLTVNFSIDDTAKILQNVDSNKAHGHDNISMCMLQLCCNSIWKPLELIFKQHMESGSFPSEWKKGNVATIYKKDDKNHLKNYRPVSLQPTCRKIFENLKNFLMKCLNSFLKMNLSLLINWI